MRSFPISHLTVFIVFNASDRDMPVKTIEFNIHSRSEVDKPILIPPQRIKIEVIDIDSDNSDENELIETCFFRYNIRNREVSQSQVQSRNRYPSTATGINPEAGRPFLQEFDDDDEPVDFVNESQEDIQTWAGNFLNRNRDIDLENKAERRRKAKAKKQRALLDDNNNMMVLGRLRPKEPGVSKPSSSCVQAANSNLPFPGSSPPAPSTSRKKVALRVRAPSWKISVNQKARNNKNKTLKNASKSRKSKSSLRSRSDPRRNGQPPSEAEDFIKVVCPSERKNWMDMVIPEARKTKPQSSGTGNIRNPKICDNFTPFISRYSKSSM